MSREIEECPFCGSKEFITSPNRYDIMIFTNGDFDWQESEFTNEVGYIYCRECGAEVDEEKTRAQKKLVLSSWPQTRIDTNN